MSGQTGSPAGTGGTGQTTQDMKREAEDMARRAKEQGRSMLEQQKETVAKQVESVGSAFRSAAGELQGDGNSRTGQYVGMLADKLESFGGQLRQRNMDGLIRDAENLGRRAPGAMFVGAMVAGFMLTRFLKSSAEHPHGTAGTSHEGGTYRPESQDMGSGPMSTGYGASSSTGMGSSPGSVGSSGTVTSGGTGMPGSTSSVGTVDRPIGTGTGTAANSPIAPTPPLNGGASTTGERWGDTSTPPGTTTGIGPTPSSSSPGSQPGGNTHGNR